MKRRDFLALLAATLAVRPLPGLAQTSARRPTVAVLLGGSQATVERWLGGLPEGLNALGYVEHRNYEIEYRYANGDLSRLPKLAEELALLHPDVVVVGGTAAAVASKRAVSGVPIVVAAATNPVQFGLAKDLSQPGGNVTGMLAGFESLAARQLELGLELLPGKKRIGMLSNLSNVASEVHRQNAETAAQTKAADLISVTASTPEALNPAMHDLAQAQVDYVIVPADAMFLSERQRIAELALTLKLPAVYAFREHAEAGGLISYGVDLREQFRHAARYVDKIVKGARPSDLPFEQPTTFELVINAATVKALGLTIPPSLLSRAEVID